MMYSMHDNQKKPKETKISLLGGRCAGSQRSGCFCLPFVGCRSLLDTPPLHLSEACIREIYSKTFWDLFSLYIGCVTHYVEFGSKIGDIMLGSPLIS